MTTIDAIKQLPIDDTLKTQILNMYEFLEPKQKLLIQRIAWNTYDLIREERIDENIEIQFEEVNQDKEKLGKGFYNNAVKKADRAMTTHVSEKASAVDLASARRAMEQIINEIHAVKAAKKKKK